MVKYILKRFIKIIPLLLLLSFLVFGLDIFALQGGMEGVSITGPSSLSALAKVYLDWLHSILTGNLGRSLSPDQPIVGELWSSLTSTTLLALPAYLLAYAVALLLGMYLAAYQNRFFDRILSFSNSILLAMPSFCIALLMVYLLGYRLSWLELSPLNTGTGMMLPDRSLPAYGLTILTLLLAILPSLTSQARIFAIKQLRRDYVQVQRSLGASQVEILFRHVSPNLILDLLKQLGQHLPRLVSLTLIIEAIYGWSGLGTYFLEGLRLRDYSVLVAVALMTAGGILLVKFLVDVVYAIINPRTRQGGEVA